MDIIELNTPTFNDLNRSNVLGNKISNISIKLIDQLLLNNHLRPSSIEAIGFHGPTISILQKIFIASNWERIFNSTSYTNKTVSNFEIWISLRMVRERL